MQNIILCSLLVGSLLATVQRVCAEVVPCIDQQKSCTCNETAEVCEFTLRIEQRQTFASYKLDPINRQQTVDGAVYFVNESGYQLANPESAEFCKFMGVTLRTDEDFTSRNCSAPMTVDGVSYRSLYSINGQTPGPTLVVTYDQTVIVHVLNCLTSEATSVHWHGLFQLNTPWMDGVGYITQPPIDPGSTFDYIFRADPFGTFWYHSHVGSQRTDGIYGALVIREPTSQPNGLPPDVIDDPGRYTLTIIDWQRESAQNLFIRLNSSLGFYPDNPVLQVPKDEEPYNSTKVSDGTFIALFPYWSGLINGRGRRGDIPTPLNVFSVMANSMYRFRVIGTESVYNHMISIDGHRLTVIATDGRNVEPFEVDYIVVHAGERYDFLINTINNDDQPGYWIRAQTLEVDLPPGTDHSARAILTYGREDSLDWRNSYSNVPEPPSPCTTESPCTVLNCPFERFALSSDMVCISLLNLTSREQQSTEELPHFPSSPDGTHFLNFAFQGPGGASSINARSFQLPNTAYQTNCDEYQNQLNANTVNSCLSCPEGESCRCINVLELASEQEWDPDAREWESIRMVFSGLTANFAHPIHMHGHAYHLVYIGYGTYADNGTLITPTTDIVCNNGKKCTNPTWANNQIPQAVLDRTSGGRVLSSAIQKDTIIIPAGGYVVIALQANNPGYWFMHCHIEEHQLQGMIVLLQEYNASQHRVPPPNINKHGSFAFTLDEYNVMLDAAIECQNITNVTGTVPTATAQTVIAPLVTSANNAIDVPVAGFGVMLAIIILLAIACVSLIIVVVVLCVKIRFNSGGADLQKESHPKGEIPLSVTTTAT